MANELLATAFSLIREATEAELGRDFDTLGMTYPTYLRNGMFIQNLIDIAVEVLPGFNGSAHAWPLLHSVRKGCQLDTAKALSYPPGTNVDEQDSLLLHIDYQNSLLEVTINSIGVDTTHLEGQFKIRDFGGVKQVASPEKLTYLGTRIRRLVQAELSVARKPPVQFSDFKGIAFSGDASNSEFSRIRETITEALPELSDRFIDAVEPKWAEAVGAARKARLLWLDPEYYQQEDGYYFVDSRNPNSHDEL